jgi:U3 small nucleolar RNA-associated protein 20
LVALKVTQRLVRLPLAGRTSVADDMTGTVLSVLSRRGAAKSHNQATSTNGQDLFQTCLRAASVIVHELGKRDDGGDDVDSIREDSVRQLLVIARESLGEGSVEMRNAALAFIRSAVAARFKTPEIYDAVDDVSRLAVRGQSANLQSTCIAISVAFLVNYPLSAKRIRQQLEFYVRNLNYKHPDGRLAALRALHTVVAKFPVPSVNAEAEFMFLPLAAVIANDEELSCRQEASETIKMLLSRVSDSRKSADMLGMTTTLLGVKEKDGANFGFEVCGGGNASLQKAGASILGVAVGSGSLSKAQILSALFSNLTVVLHGSGPDSRQAWEVTHAALSSTELAFDALALLGEAARAELSSDLAPFWNLMPALLQQQHLWVRGVSCRLLGRHFAALGADCMCHGGQSRQYSLFNGPLGSVRDLIKSLCLVLESSVLSESLAEQTLKNLLYIGNCVRLHPAVGEAGLSTTLDDDDDSERDGVVEDGAGESRKESEREPNRGLYWLLRRLSGMAIRPGQSDSALLRRACAVRFLAAAVASWGVTSIKPYLRLFISPVVRVVDRKADLIARNGPVSAAAEAAAAAIVAMAEATQEMLVKELGADEYYVIYNELKAQRRAEQNERKRKHAVEAAIDPERAAKKRIKRSAAKSRARRRKTSEGQGRGQAWRVAHSTYAADGRDLNPLRDD